MIEAQLQKYTVSFFPCVPSVITFFQNAMGSNGNKFKYKFAKRANLSIGKIDEDDFCEESFFFLFF